MPRTPTPAPQSPGAPRRHPRERARCRGHAARTAHDRDLPTVGRPGRIAQERVHAVASENHPRIRSIGGADGELLSLIGAMDVGQRPPSGDHAGDIAAGIVADTSPPSEGMIRISGTVLPPPRLVNAMRSPSGEKRGTPSSASSLVRRRRAPPLTRPVYKSKRPLGTARRTPPCRHRATAPDRVVCSSDRHDPREGTRRRRCAPRCRIACARASSTATTAATEAPRRVHASVEPPAAARLGDRRHRVMSDWIASRAARTSPAC